MSVSNDGVERGEPIPLDSRGLCYIAGRRYNNVGALQVNPVAIIGSRLADQFIVPMAATYCEISGGGVDFHTGQATVDDLDYDARLTVSGAAAVNGGADLTISARSIILGNALSAGNMSGMDVVVAGAIAVPADAPFMATYSATAAGGFTLPAASAGRRFTLVNASGAGLAIAGAACVNAAGGAIAVSPIASGSQVFVSSYATAGGYAWRGLIAYPGA